MAADASVDKGMPDESVGFLLDTGGVRVRRDPPLTLRVLLVDDDEDDYLITRDMLAVQDQTRFELEWCSDYTEALVTMRAQGHDVYLIDYHLGDHTGLELIREAFPSLHGVPLIMLTGHGDYETDLAATGLGVTDFLVKQQLDARSLERSIRYAVSHQHAMHDLVRSEERYSVASSAAHDGIWDWDLNSDRIYFSSRWREILGQIDREGDEASDAWFDLVHPDDLSAVRTSIDQHLAGETEYLQSEFRMRHADGSWRLLITRGAVIRGPDGTAVRLAGSISDLTDQRGLEQKLRHDALHDSLTGLSNRTLFIDRIDQVLQRAARDPELGCAVLFLDIDRFKLINDSLGHAAGDRMLVAFADRMSNALRPSDTVARLGGDEFTVLLTDTNKPKEALAVAARLHQALEKTFSIDGNELVVNASIGISLSTPPITAAGLLRNADIAMYDAKHRGPARSAVFSDAMHRRVADRLALETKLREALDQSLLRVYYQPIVDLTTGRICAIEALARWPERWTPVTPLDFIPVAEETGLIGALGLHVLHTALATLASWRQAGLLAQDVPMSVNVSSRQLNDPGLAGHVRAALADANLSASSLLLEITEGTLMHEPERMQAIINQLSQTGVGLHLDDFGTGHSSLSALYQYPVNALKIDRTFVSSVSRETLASEVIIRSTVAVAHTLDIDVIAEGIEYGSQLRRLRALGCQRGQGFFFSEPRSRRDTETLLKDWPATWTANLRPRIPAVATALMRDASRECSRLPTIDQRHRPHITNKTTPPMSTRSDRDLPAASAMPDRKQPANADETDQARRLFRVLPVFDRSQVEPLHDRDQAPLEPPSSR
jgi:diguanylate cyclase (GGDEF)-like protein/PAS domain S-box-containing protein